MPVDETAPGPNHRAINTALDNKSQQPTSPPQKNASLTFFLRFLMRTAWKPVSLAAVLGTLSGIGGALLISMVNQAIREPSQTGSSALFVLLIIGTMIALILSQYVLISLAQKTIAKLRLNMAEGILASRLSHLESLGDHKLLATLTSDIRSLSNSLTALPGLLASMANIVTCLVYLAWLSGPAFIVLVLLVGITAASVRKLMRHAQKSFSLARKQEDELIENFGSTIHGVKELKLSRMRREDFVTNDLEPNITNLLTSMTKAMRLFAWTEAIGHLSLLGILGCFVYLLPGFAQIDQATIASVAVTVLYLMGPFIGTLRRLPDLSRGSVSLQKIDSLNLSLSDDIESLNTTAPPPIASSCALSVDQLTFDYPNDEGDQGFCLGPVSFTLKPGTITYLTGGNGSGKSTIAKLIVGLYEPDRGSIQLNDTKITDENREWYREHVAVVFSDFHLFNRCLGAEICEDEIAEFLNILELQDKVKVDSSGLISTTSLSSGQRKRLAMLNAWLDKDRPLYLFDEWASEQDPEFREKFYTEILVRLREKGKTVLVITHDDRYFHLADQLLTLEYGQLRTNTSHLIAASLEPVPARARATGLTFAAQLRVIVFSPTEIKSNYYYFGKGTQSTHIISRRFSCLRLNSHPQPQH